MKLSRSVGDGTLVIVDLLMVFQVEGSYQSSGNIAGSELCYIPLPSGPRDGVRHLGPPRERNTWSC